MNIIHNCPPPAAASVTIAPILSLRAQVAADRWTGGYSLEGIKAGITGKEENHGMHKV